MAISEFGLSSLDYEDKTDFNNTTQQGFRHTSSECNNICRGRPRHDKNGLQVAEDAQRKPVTGTGLQERVSGKKRTLTDPRIPTDPRKCVIFLKCIIV